MKTIDRISKYKYTTIDDISDKEYKYDESFNLISMKDTFIDHKKHKSHIIFRKDYFIKFGINFMDENYTKRNKTILSISNFKYNKTVDYLTFRSVIFKPIIRNMRNISTKQ